MHSAALQMLRPWYAGIVARDPRLTHARPGCNVVGLGGGLAANYWGFTYPRTIITYRDGEAAYLGSPLAIHKVLCTQLQGCEPHKIHCAVSAATQCQ